MVRSVCEVGSVCGEECVVRSVCEVGSVCDVRVS